MEAIKEKIGSEIQLNGWLHGIRGSNKFQFLTFRTAGRLIQVIADKEILKNSIKEMMEKDPNFVLDLFEGLEQKLENAKKERLSQIVDEDFEEYKDVFKALA